MSTVTDRFDVCRRRLPLVLLAAGLALTGACSDPAPGGAAGGTGTGGFDVSGSIGFDTYMPPDSAADGVPDSAGDLTLPGLEVASDDSSLNDGSAGEDGQAGQDAVATGEFGQPCLSAEDCDTGLCVEDAGGKVCSKLCQSACPAGWTCATLQSGSSDAQTVCIPTFARLCDPCLTAEDCSPPGVTGGLCLPTGKDGADGKFCAMACLPSKPASCPVDFQCAAAGGGYACLPKAGECACSATAAAKELQTTCHVASDLGSCQGQRSCAGGQLSACSAAGPAGESCNGKDDDCDGLTDEVEAQPCQTKNEFGTCVGMVTGCQADTTLCSAKNPAPESCNGQDDDCDGQTDENLCDDGKPCTDGLCNPDGSCQQKPADGPCDDGNPCTQKDVCAAGQCSGGDPKVCDDANPCTADACDPQKGCVASPAPPGTACADDGVPCTLDQCQEGQCAHPAAPPGTACSDDGNPCTADQCQAGQCAHPAAPPGTPCKDDGNPCTSDQCSGAACDHPAAPPGTACQDDGNACTDDTCSGDQCGHPPAKVGTTCPDDGDACTADTCDGAGTCNHPVGIGLCQIGGKCIPAGQPSPQNPCLICDPSVTPSQYSAKDGLLCEDGNPCTVGDKCLGAQCQGSPKSCSSLDGTCTLGQCSAATGACVATPKPSGTACSDGNGCTSQDVCDAGGKCAGKAVDCSALNDGCNTGTCSNGQCLKQQKGNGTVCSDGDACTTGDTCQTGTCSGKLMNCSAKADQCNDGACSAGACVAKPKANGLGCNDATTCTSNDKCSAGKCVGTAVSDSYEPNNSSSAAKPLTTKSDCDGASNLQAWHGSGDVDWYTFTANDDSFCTIKPNAKLDQLAADYDVCVYFTCKGKTPTSGMVSCNNGSKVTGTGPSGASGCCSTNTGTTSDFAKLSPNCSLGGLGSEAGTVWVSVTAKGGAICGGYQLSWAAKDL